MTSPDSVDSISKQATSANTTPNSDQSPSRGKTLRRLYSLARPEAASLGWALFFLILASGAGLAYPQIIRWLVDNVLDTKRLDLLLPVVGGLFAAFLLQSFAGAIRYYLFTMAGERIVTRLRKRLYRQILSQEVAFFDFNRTGDLMSRLSSDCTTLQNTVSVNLSMSLRNLGQVIGGVIFMFFTSWKLTLIMLVILPPTAVAAALFGRRIRKFANGFQQALAEASIIAEETISGVRTVKSFVQEHHEERRYSLTLDDALNLARKRVRSVTEFMTIAMVVSVSAVCFVLWYGGREVILGQMSGGDLTQFLLYLMIAAIGMGSLGGLWGDLMAGVGASLRIFDILEKAPQVNDWGEAPDNSTVRGHIEFKDVSFTYPSRPEAPVIKGLSFEVKPGQTVALVGSSGGGKSTVASLLSAFYEPDSGQISLDGRDISGLKTSLLREQIGIVSQEPVLISTTIEENIRYGNPQATDEEVSAAARAANATEFVESFPQGLKTRVGEKGVQLSGGQKQRIAIARAVLKNPKVLILDEATSNLDTQSESLVQEALYRLMRDRTTLVIAHRLSTVKSSHEILVMQEGRVVQRGVHEELADDREGLYYRLLQGQFVAN